MQVCLVGTRHFNTFGSHGSADFVRYSFFPTLQECCRVLKEDRGAHSSRMPCLSVSLTRPTGTEFRHACRV